MFATTGASQVLADELDDQDPTDAEIAASNQEEVALPPVLFAIFEDLARCYVGPFADNAAVQAHVEFCSARGDAASFLGCVDSVPAGEFTMTPEEDCADLLVIDMDGHPCEGNWVREPNQTV